MIILAGVIGGIAVVVAVTIVIVLWVRRYRKSTGNILLILSPSPC